MRFLVIAVAIVAGSSQVVGQPDWVPEQTGVSTTFNSVHFGDAFFGYAVGDSGIIAFANSQGGTWTPVSFGDSIVFHDVSTIFSVYIWVVGSDGLIFHKGLIPPPEWTQQNSQTERDLYSVHFIDVWCGWAVGDSGTIIHTCNEGDVWTVQSSGVTNRLLGVHFESSSTGWAVGDGGTVLHTTDGGAVWVPQSTGIDADLYSVHFVDVNTGWAVGQSDGDGSAGVIIHTTDAGNTWTEQNNPTASALADVVFADAYNGWAVGGHGDPGVILHTTNGGTLWTEQLGGTNESYNGVHFFDANLGWVVGTNGAGLRTTTGGTGVDPPPPPTLISPQPFSVVPTSPELTWGPGGASWYSLQVSTNSSFVTHCVNLGGIDTTFFRLDSLERAERYYWRVSVTDWRGTSSWSQAWNFVTEGDLPEQVTLVSPPHGTTVKADTIRLFWSQGESNIDFYDVDIAHDSLFTDPILFVELPRDSSLLFHQLYGIETHWWRVRAVNPIGAGPFTEGWKFSMITTGVNPEEQLPWQFTLHQNYPNPFNPTTTITYSLPRSGDVSLKIFNLLGEEVATLVSGQMDAGTHTVQWDATGQPSGVSAKGRRLDSSSGYASGVYFYRLQTRTFVETRKLVLLR